MKKEITEQEAFLQLAALCAQAEHCQQEMRDKLKRWDIDETTQERIIQRLVRERYVDDERYARAFVPSVTPSEAEGHQGPKRL